MTWWCRSNAAVSRLLRPNSWSDINRNRWLELKTAGLLSSAGLAAAPTNNTYAPRPVVPDLPVYIAKALKANSKAWEFFRGLAPTYRRDFVVWIHTAKRPETRQRRIRESIALMAAGKKTWLEVDGSREEFSGICNDPTQAACRSPSTGLSHSASNAQAGSFRFARRI